MNKFSVTKNLILMLLCMLLIFPVFFLENHTTVLSEGGMINLLDDGNFELSEKVIENESLSECLFSKYWENAEDSCFSICTKGIDLDTIDDFSLKAYSNHEKDITHKPITLQNKAYRFGGFIKPISISPEYEKENYLSTITFEIIGNEGVIKSKTYNLRQFQKNKWNEIYFYFMPSSIGNYSLRIYTPKSYYKNVYLLDNLYIRREQPQTIDNENVKLVDGASIRINSESPGIRFQGKINYDFKRQLDKEQASVVAGIIITPSEYIDKASDFTLFGLEVNEVQFMELNAVKWNNEGREEKDGYFGFNCFMVNVLPQNVDRHFSARAFIKYVDPNTGVSEFIYSDYDEKVNSRSVYDIASYWKARPEYFSSSQLTFLDSYLNLRKTLSSVDVTINGLTKTYRFTNFDKGIIKLMDIPDGVAYSVTYNGNPVTLSSSKSFEVEKSLPNAEILISLTSLNGLELDDVLSVYHYSNY